MRLERAGIPGVSSKGLSDMISGVYAGSINNWVSLAPLYLGAALENKMASCTRVLVRAQYTPRENEETERPAQIKQYVALNELKSSLDPSRSSTELHAYLLPSV